MQQFAISTGLFSLATDCTNTVKNTIHHSSVPSLQKLSEELQYLYNIDYLVQFLESIKGRNKENTLELVSWNARISSKWEFKRCNRSCRMSKTFLWWHLCQICFHNPINSIQNCKGENKHVWRHKLHLFGSFLEITEDFNDIEPDVTFLKDVWSGFPVRFEEFVQISDFFYIAKSLFSAENWVSGSQIVPNINIEDGSL